MSTWLRWTLAAFYGLAVLQRALPVWQLLLLSQPSQLSMQNSPTHRLLAQQRFGRTLGCRAKVLLQRPLRLPLANMSHVLACQVN